MQSPIAKWRKLLQAERSALKSQFETKAGTSAALRQQSRLVDGLLRDLWQEAGIPQEISLIAVGGYGRGELFPYSDVDLLILLPDSHASTYNNILEPLIGMFWDIGLAVGHSVRTLQECVEEARKDVTVQTNLLESRFLIGNRTLFRQMREQLFTSLDAQQFFQLKTLEQSQRHARFNDTAYNLEPNIKESPGGLRDLQTILWISQAVGLGENWLALARNGLITQSEVRQIRRHERFLHMLRIRLHYLAGRREDRLLFDVQNELASQLGYANTPRRRASEQLMQRYYRSAKFVRIMNEILLQNLQERAFPVAPEITDINTRFQIRNGLLETRAPNLLQREPTAILESFLLLQQHPQIKGMSAPMLRTLWRVKKLVNRDFRQNPQNKHLFMEILRQPAGITAALRRMNHYGILGRYIPSFGRITGQMQHDLFHVYTVDEHILNVLRNIRRFTVPRFQHEFPLCSELIAQFEKSELLYLAALFHDIAKGRGGDHSALGTVDATRFCRQHGLSPEETQFVSWLVGKHLFMSGTAQKSDLSDPAVIEHFAQEMRDERHLTALYLLTVADIRGTSPAVWNAWKAKLLESLFLATRRVLRSQGTSLQTELSARRQQATDRLNHYGIAAASYQEMWQKLGDNYFLRHESQEIAWHTRLLLAHLHSEKPIVRTRLSPEGDGIQVMVYTRDRDDLFAAICGVFERLNYTIVEAKIHTTLHGYALDSFLVLDESDRSVRYRDLLSYIEYELTQRLSSTQALEAPMQGRVSRQLKHFPIATTVNITTEPSGQQFLLSVVAGDRPGLLSRIAQTLLKYDIQLHTAKINTLGDRAEDSFLISSHEGGPLAPQVVESLEKELLSGL
jgi:[protein-PII] uridylyltransferase